MEEQARQNTVDEMITILEAFKTGNSIERRFIDKITIVKKNGYKIRNFNRDIVIDTRGYKAYSDENGYIELEEIDHVEESPWEDVALPNFDFERYQYKLKDKKYKLKDKNYIICLVNETLSENDHTYLSYLDYDKKISNVCHSEEKALALKFTKEEAEDIVTKLKECVKKYYIYAKPFRNSMTTDEVLDKAYSPIKDTIEHPDITEEQKKEVIRLFTEEDKTQLEINKIMNISRPVIRRVLIESGIDTTQNSTFGSITREIRDKIVERANSGYTQRAIAKELGIGVGSVSRILKEEGFVYSK